MWLALLAAAAQWLAACATLPGDPVERSLYLDLRRAVELSEDTEWIADASQLDDNLENALLSLCQVDPTNRANLGAWLAAQLMQQGGSPESVYRAHRGDLDAAGEALTLDRVRKLLEYAHGRAGRDCPFWLEPRDDFRGAQAGAERVVLWLESIGGGQAIIEGPDVGLGGSGGGRLLTGYAFNHRTTLVTGIELGGGGVFVNGEGGGQTIETAFYGAAPLLLRTHGASRVYDAELALVFPILDASTDRALGVRANIGYGVGTMRKGAFMPYVVLIAGYELHPATHDSRANHTIILGSRVGIDWLL